MTTRWHWSRAAPSASARRSSRDLARHGFAVAIHCNALARGGGGAGRQIGDGAAGRQSCRPISADRDAVAGLVDRGRGRTRPRARCSSTMPPLFEDDDAPSSTGKPGSAISRVHLEAPVQLWRGHGRAACPSDADGPGRQHHRPARLEAHAALLFLYAVQIGAVDGDADAWRRRLRRRLRVNAIGPGPTLQERAPGRGDFDAQTKALLLEARAGSGRVRRRRSASVGGAFGDRTDDRARWRAAPCMGNAGRDGDRGMSAHPASRRGRPER